MYIKMAAAFGAALIAFGQPALSQPSVEDYEHAIGLRSAWSGLTENIAWPAQWIEGTHRFVYRKTVPGGFQFIVMDAETRQKQPAFDHDRLAAALSAATGKVFSGLHLPFTEPSTEVEIGAGGRELTAQFDEAAFKCSLSEYVCSRLPPHRGHQPRGFEAVRDLRVPADNSRYAKSSGVQHAKNLVGHILLVVGEQDTNVDPSSTMQVVNALIKSRKDFDLLVVPNEGHSVFRSTGDLSYGLRRQYDFFVRHLRHEPTPDWNVLP